jgi:lipoprotein-anchoring transpeptidase ErfK/SrfK
MTAGASPYRLVQGGIGVLALLALLLPPSHLGNTSYTPESTTLKAGIFAFSASNPRGYERIIDVDVWELFLVLREQSGGEIRRYPIAGPRPKDIPKPLTKKGELFGNVDRIIINPWWHPTPEIRQEWQAKGRELSERIPPGSPLNAMGRAKIVIKFEDYSEPLRIHGTNQPRSIGRHASRGCIRMHNRDILELAELLRGRRSLVLFRYGRADAKGPTQQDSRI